MPCGTGEGFSYALARPLLPAADRRYSFHELSEFCQQTMQTAAEVVVVGSRSGVTLTTGIISSR